VLLALIALLLLFPCYRGLRFQDSLLPFSLDAIEQNPAIKTLARRNASSSTDTGITNNQSHASASITNSDDSANSQAHSHPDKADPARLSNEDSSANLPGRDGQRHRPRTVHLPPKEVQEERFREKQLRQEARRRDAAESEKAQVEAASSPISTAGAPSIATSLPAGPSPLTSTDEDTTSANPTVSVPLSLQPSPEEVFAKEQHDKLLQSQKEIAYREALGHEDDSPDVQLRLEQEQAAKATRDATSNAKPSSMDVDDNTSTAIAARDGSQAAASTQAHSESPSDSFSDASQKKRAPRPSLVNIMPPRDPALANAIAENTGAVRTQSSLEVNELSRPSLFATKRAHTTGEVLKIKTEQPVVRRQQRPIKEQPQSPVSLRCSELMKKEGYNTLKGVSVELNKDYLEPLYRIQVHEPPNGRPLHELLQKASKVITTTEQFAGYHERQDQRILRRIYQLQNANRWSLRQMQPCAEPAAPKTHMDHLMAEMKWMRTDFRQERKMKRATAKFFAEQCAEWYRADKDIRGSMQIRVKSVEALGQDTAAPHSPAESNFENSDRHSQGGQSPPGLDNDVESSVEDFDAPRTPQYATVVPSSFFPAINMDKETFHMQDNETLHSALADLPLLTPFDEDETPAHLTVKRPTPAVSKFCAAKMMIDVSGPPKKRSRYDYSDDEDTMDDISKPASKRPRASQDESGLRPEQTDVALFEPENKLLRSRLHQNTAFRPPSEFQMPSSQFYEFRVASQWTEEDQQALRRLAKDYSFNWSLIADNLSLSSRFTSASDRRTPWECFERWVELESLPNEMRKTLYFKTWNQRLEGANRNNEAKYQQQIAQLAQTPGQPPTVMRKKTTPFKVDKRRQNRYLHMVDAMRKLARKREQQAHKQAEGEVAQRYLMQLGLTDATAQKAAHMRKQHENAAPKNGIPTPQEFSKMRQERDVQVHARQERYREQMLVQQRVCHAISSTIVVFKCSLSYSKLKCNVTARCRTNKRIPMLMLPTAPDLTCLIHRALKHNLADLNRSITRVCQTDNTPVLLLKEVLIPTRHSRECVVVYHKLRCNPICDLRPTAKLMEHRMACSKEYLRRRGPTKRR
jgi:chromatin modification-related protein VID21